jgi:hypothetical protein
MVLGYIFKSKKNVLLYKMVKAGNVYQNRIMNSIRKPEIDSFGRCMVPVFGCPVFGSPLYLSEQLRHSITSSEFEWFRQNGS